MPQATSILFSRLPFFSYLLSFSRSEAYFSSLTFQVHSYWQVWQTSCTRLCEIDTEGLIYDVSELLVVEMDQKSPASEASGYINSPPKSILHRPVGTVREVLQRIASHEAIPKIDRSRSHVAFQDAELETHRVQLINEDEENGDTVNEELPRRLSVSFNINEGFRRGSNDTCSSQEEEIIPKRGISNSSSGFLEVRRWPNNL